VIDKPQLSLCTRCGNPVTGNFCSECGAPTAAGMRDEHIQEVSSEVTGVDVWKAWRTIRDLTVRPGTVALAYVSGNRAKYMSPIAYCLFIFTISITLDSVTGINRYILNRAEVSWSDQYREDIQQKGVQAEEKDMKITKVHEHLMDFVNGKSGQMVLFLPSILLFQWLLFRKYRKSFIENAYFALFSSSHYILLMLPLTALFFVDKELFYYLYLIVGVIVPVIYAAWAGVAFYRQPLRPLLGRNVVLEVLTLAGVAITTIVISMAVATIVLAID
jgi:ribosomal protein L37E